MAVHIAGCALRGTRLHGGQGKHIPDHTSRGASRADVLFGRTGGRVINVGVDHDADLGLGDRFFTNWNGSTSSIPLDTYFIYSLLASSMDREGVCLAKY